MVQNVFVRILLGATVLKGYEVYLRKLHNYILSGAKTDLLHASLDSGLGKNEVKLRHNISPT
jgi:hypothetical protein